jgi:hypothetical protein
MVPFIMLMPASFVMCFTFAMISLIVAFAFLSGPRVYIKKLFIQKNLYASVLLFISILSALWFSLVDVNYIYSLVCCVFELNSVLFFYCNTTAVNLDTLKWIWWAGKNAM